MEGVLLSIRVAAHPDSQALSTAQMQPQVWLVAGDCCLIGLQPVLVHLSKAGKDSYAFHPVSINFLVEVAKTSVAIVVLLAYVSLLPTRQQVLMELDQLQFLNLDHSRRHTQ